MTTVENDAERSGISIKDLIRLHSIGFKLIPLDERGDPVDPWTPIYDNPNYWTPEQLTQEAAKFKNVATTFGQTHLKDGEGLPLYLYSLDIDSDKVYNRLFRLQNGHNPEYSFTALIVEKTFVTKTRKPNGLHVYWLSHKQHIPIAATDCKPGYEFEIKCNKSMCTLPDSIHRDDHKFRYKNIGQEKLWTNDVLYDKLKETLADCLKPKLINEERGRGYHSYTSGSYQIEFKDAEIQVISSAIDPYYKKGCRQSLVYALSGIFRKYDVSKESALNLIQILAKDDEERRSRIATVEETYKKDPRIVTGSKYLLDVLKHATADHNTAKEIIEKIFQLIGKGDVIQRLTRNIMSEYFFATMRDTEDVYYYNGEGLYVLGGESLINELCELMYPPIKTHELNEVLGHIKRRTYVEPSKFDSNIDVLNLRNGLLNIHTNVLSPHTPEYFSSAQLPIEYNPRTVCPKILEFLSAVLRPKDIHIMIQIIGYCLYRSCECEKAVMFFGTGANGKGVLIKLIEAFLGESNCSHRSLQDLDRNRFAVAGLRGKLANTFADLKSLRLSETGNFKMLTSGDSVTGEHKFEHPFSFRNYSKLIFSANEIPESDDKTDAFYRRWLILHFDKKFQNGKEDTKLIKKLTTPEELRGLLNLALIGLKQLLHDGGFHDKDVEELRKDYEEHTNDVNAFLCQQCMIDISNPEYSTLATDVYAAYVTFCSKRGTRPKDMPVFGKKLSGQGIYSNRHQDHGPRESYYEGIKLRKDMRGFNQALD